MHRKSVFEGTQAPSMMKLNRICKGFRRGELVIFTGPTGSGKTTFLSQLSLDFAKQDKATLWGSFEIKNSRLIQKMLHQFYQKGDLKLLDPVKLESIADDFENLPLQFLNFHGGTELSQVLEALDVAVIYFSS
jgi:twinkle protein